MNPNRHRTNRGGDRQAKAGLWQIVFVRLGYDRRTPDYDVKRTAEGKSKAEIMRCLKRYGRARGLRGTAPRSPRLTVEAAALPAGSIRDVESGAFSRPA
jgi:hypothetical protein